jgi:hypothetical protein
MSFSILQLVVVQVIRLLYLGCFELIDWFVGVLKVLVTCFWVEITKKLGFLTKTITTLIFYGHHSGGLKLGLQATYHLCHFFFLKKGDNMFSSPLQNKIIIIINPKSAIL